MEKLRAAVAQATGWVAKWRSTRPTPQGIVGRDDQFGQGLAEYALILALIAIVAIVSLALLGVNISEMFMDPISEDFGEVLSRLGI